MRQYKHIRVSYDTSDGYSMYKYILMCSKNVLLSFATCSRYTVLSEQQHTCSYPQAGIWLYEMRRKRVKWPVATTRQGSPAHLSFTSLRKCVSASLSLLQGRHLLLQVRVDLRPHMVGFFCICGVHSIVLVPKCSVVSTTNNQDHSGEWLLALVT